LLRIGEVTDALGVANVLLKDLLGKMHTSMPKATANRTIGARKLMERGERAVPFAGHRDEEPRAAHGGGEGKEVEAGHARAQCLKDGGGADEGGIVAETPGVCEPRPRSETPAREGRWIG
jgi:hypothetical protein